VAVTGGGQRAGLGGWLREQRRVRGWDVPQMARRLAVAAGAERGTLPSKECLLVYIRRWERGTVGVSERYRLLYCRAFGIELTQFGGQPGDGNGPAAGDDGGGEPGVMADGGAADGGEPGPAGGRWLAGLLRDIRDGLRADAKSHEARAEQMTAGAVCAALCRGQALAYADSAEQIDAALASCADVGPPP
jgi:hypothetical protein